MFSYYNLDMARSWTENIPDHTWKNEFQHLTPTAYGDADDDADTKGHADDASFSVRSGRTCWSAFPRKCLLCLQDTNYPNKQVQEKDEVPWLHLYSMWNLN